MRKRTVLVQETSVVEKGVGREVVFDLKEESQVVNVEVEYEIILVGCRKEKFVGNLVNKTGQENAFWWEEFKWLEIDQTVFFLICTKLD